MKHEMMKNQKEAQEKLKQELRRNVQNCEEERNLEEDMMAGQKNVVSGSVFDQDSDLTRKSSDDISSGGKDQHRLQAPVECDLPRTPTPDYADLNARFII